MALLIALESMSMDKPGSIVRVACVLACAAGSAFAAESPPARSGFVLESRVLGENRRINVQVPPRYDVDARSRYPVLYMPDGGLAEDFPHVAATVDAAMRAGEMQAMILVGIENTERRRDMTGPTTVARDRTIAPRVGGSAAFRAFIADELMPEIERRYRTGPRRAIVGESLAGLFVLETLFVRPELFDTYVALSPSLWWNGGALVERAAVRLAAWPADRARRLYFATAGDDDVGGAALALRDALRAHAPAGLRWQHETWADLDHATIYRGASPAVFRKVFPRPRSRRRGPRRSRLPLKWSTSRAGTLRSRACA